MDPILISIAAAAAGKASEAVVKSGTVALGRAAELVRRRFAGRAELEGAQQGTIDIEDLAAAVDRACASDGEFSRLLGEAAGRPIRVAKFHNEFHGDVKNVVQADTIHNLRLD